MKQYVRRCKVCDCLYKTSAKTGSKCPDCRKVKTRYGNDKIILWRIT